MVTDTLTVGLEELGDDGASLVNICPTQFINKYWY